MHWMWSDAEAAYGLLGPGCVIRRFVAVMALVMASPGSVAAADHSKTQRQRPLSSYTKILIQAGV